jgi:hypothetical protein
MRNPICFAQRGGAAAYSVLIFTLLGCGGSPDEQVQPDPFDSEQVSSAAVSCANLSVSALSASGFQQDPGNTNPPANVLDNDLGTRWSNNGKGSWIQADLGGTKTVCSVQLAWFVGNTRKSSFRVDVSSDGTAFTTVFTGQSSGLGTGLETYDFADVQARFVRIIVNGNLSNDGRIATDWASVTELRVVGADAAPPPPPPASGFPAAFNTGYPRGLPGDTRTPVSLTPYTGPCTITTAGTIIDKKDIRCTLNIRAKNVVIRNSRIRVANASAVDTRDNDNRVLIEDTELDGQGLDNSAGGIALVGFAGFILRRVDAHGSGDIIRANGWAEIHDSFLHDPRGLQGSQHHDIIQSTNAVHLRIVHNRLENPHTQTSCILLKADQGNISDVLVDRNLMNGGGYSFYWYDHNTGVYRISNGTVSNNRFMRAPAGYWPKGGYHGARVFSAVSLPTWTNNVWDDNGSVIPR